MVWWCLCHIMKEVRRILILAMRSVNLYAIVNGLMYSLPVKLDHSMSKIHKYDTHLSTQPDELRNNMARLEYLWTWTMKIGKILQ